MPITSFFNRCRELGQPWRRACWPHWVRNAIRYASAEEVPQISGLVIGHAVLPATKHDANPFEGQGSHYGMVVLLEKKKIEGFIATDKESYRDRQQPGPRGPLPQGATATERARG